MAIDRRFNAEIPWIIAVGASGCQGLRDLQELLRALPLNLPAAILVVLHRPWSGPTYLQDVLAEACPLPIVVPTRGDRFEVGTVYIGEPAAHLTLAATRIAEIIDDPYRRYANRTVDLLFKSVAAWTNKQKIGVVLSGELDDGSRGLAAIHTAGGMTMVLTPAQLPQRGMPENAISYNGPIDLIGNPCQIAEGICAACLAQKS